MKNFGKRLIKLRQDRGLSIEELAKELNLTKVCLLCWENNQLTLSIKKLIKIAKYFSTTVDYLLGL